jgi:hypothetical protein
VLLLTAGNINDITLAASLLLPDPSGGSSPIAATTPTISAAGWRPNTPKP